MPAVSCRIDVSIAVAGRDTTTVTLQQMLTKINHRITVLMGIAIIGLHPKLAQLGVDHMRIVI